MTNKLRLGRRDALTMVTGTAIAATAGEPAEAADIALSCWTGYPELVAWYKERGDAYAKDHPGFSLNLLSTTLREHEQKLTQTKSGKWHQNYDNDAGRDATKFYIDAVQVNRVDDPKILHDARCVRLRRHSDAVPRGVCDRRDPEEGAELGSTTSRRSPAGRPTGRTKR
jgi:hypothetical protein